MSLSCPAPSQVQRRADCSSRNIWRVLEKERFYSALRGPFSSPSQSCLGPQEKCWHSAQHWVLSPGSASAAMHTELEGKEREVEGGRFSCL